MKKKKKKKGGNPKQMIDFLILFLVVGPQLVVFYLKYKLQTKNCLRKSLVSVAYSTFISLMVILSFQIDYSEKLMSNTKYTIQTLIINTPRTVVFAIFSLLLRFSYIPKVKSRLYKKRQSIIITVTFLVLFIGVAAHQFAYYSIEEFGPLELDQLIYNMAFQLPGNDTLIFIKKYYFNFLQPKILEALFLSIVLFYIFPCHIEFDESLFCFHRIINIHFQFKMYYAVLILFVGYIYRGLIIMDIFKIDDFDSTDIFTKYYVNPTSVIIDYPEVKRNFILIQLESLEMTFGKIENGGMYNISYIPELETIALDPNNVHFSNTNKLGGPGKTRLAHWTNAAMVAYGAGLPLKMGKIPGEVFLPNIVTFTDILENAGYKEYNAVPFPFQSYGNTYIYSTHGNATVYDRDYIINYLKLENFDESQMNSISDCYLYDFTKKVLPEIAKDGKPFVYVIETMDTHCPGGKKCHLCRESDIIHKQDPNSHIEMIWRCTSRQILDLINWLKEQEFYNNTTVFLLGDHFYMGPLPNDMHLKMDERTIYNVLVNPAINCSKERRHNRKLSTYDWFPTMLASIGFKIHGERLGFGTNLFSDKETYMEEGIDFNSQVKKYSKYYRDRILGVDGSPGMRFIFSWHPVNESNTST